MKSLSKLTFLDWLIVVAALVFTGAEYAVSQGISLPGSDEMPWWLRGLGYVVTVGGGLGLRWIAMKRLGVQT